MKYKRNICIHVYAYLHNLCKLVIFFITIKKKKDELHHFKVFLQKT